MRWPMLSICRVRRACRARNWQQAVSPMLLSFMSESRRLSNARIKEELGVRLALSAGERRAGNDV